MAAAVAILAVGVVVVYDEEMMRTVMVMREELYVTVNQHVRPLLELIIA